MNIAGNKPKELADFVVASVVKEPDYSNLDGQESLSRFENSFKKKKNKGKPNNGPTASLNMNPNQKPNFNKPQNTQQQESANINNPKPMTVQGQTGEQTIGATGARSNNKKRRKNNNRPRPNTPSNNENND